MIRRIIQIDEDRCNGCGICAEACHEGAIGMVNGKAKLLRDDYCDGLGDCLPTCPTGAITFVEREAAAYDEEAVKANMAARTSGGGHPAAPDRRAAAGEAGKENGGIPCGCPSAMARGLSQADDGACIMQEAQKATQTPAISRLAQWPVQIKLAPVKAPYFQGANLLIAADCSAYAYGDFHNRFMKNHVTLIGCPKLDEGDYSEKLTEIMKNNEIRSLTIVRMEVPCCGGIEMAAKRALQASGKFIPWQVVTISIDGQILE